MKRFAAACMLIAIVQPVFAAQQLQLEHTERAVVVSRVTPGAAVALYVLSRTPREFESRVTRHATILRDDDLDGVVRYDSDAPIAVKTISFAADLASGAFAIGTPPGHPLRELPVKALLRSHLAPGRSALDPEREFYDLLVVRPGTGTWYQVIGDGGMHDSDRAINGSALGALNTLRPVGSSPAAPAALQRGDVVLIIDSRRMDAAAAPIR